MSAFCGYLGSAEPEALERMLAAVALRGDEQELALEPDFAIGYRFTRGRPGESAAIARSADHVTVCAGTLAPGVACPSSALSERLTLEPAQLDDLDGSFAFAHFHRGQRTLTLGRDPFGVRALYQLTRAGTLYFASELPALLALPGVARDLDASVIHKYLTFSFVPGSAMPIRGVLRLAPGELLRVRSGERTSTRYFQLREQIDPRFQAPELATRVLRRVAKHATRRRLYETQRAGLFLSGGLDSASVAVWLKQAGVEVHAFSLDFGPHSVERAEAAEVASALGIAQTWISVSAEQVRALFDDVVQQLALPFGDPVTVPQYMLGQAARAAGLDCVFNGEGGDQLFGGWTNKPMIAAELYAGMYEDDEESRAATYLRSYHRFYGSEQALYTPGFLSAAGPAGQRRALLAPYLHDDEQSFLSHVRLADIALKGSDNILPRAAAMAHAFGLRLCAPLFDRRLARLAFRLPPQLKLHGACEKYVLKLAMQPHLPREIVWRRKTGMSVPITDFVFAPPLVRLADDLLGPDSVRARGLFRPEFVAQLRAGRDLPHETRRRRIGERLWTLMMLEAWLRRFVDRHDYWSVR